MQQPEPLFRKSASHANLSVTFLKMILKARTTVAITYETFCRQIGEKVI
jgi:hypothetical protein